MVERNTDALPSRSLQTEETYGKQSLSYYCLKFFLLAVEKEYPTECLNMVSKGILGAQGRWPREDSCFLWVLVCFCIAALGLCCCMDFF